MQQFYKRLKGKRMVWYPTGFWRPQVTMIEVDRSEVRVLNGSTPLIFLTSTRGPASPGGFNEFL